MKSVERNVAVFCTACGRKGFFLYWFKKWTPFDVHL